MMNAPIAANSVLELTVKFDEVKSKMAQAFKLIADAQNTMLAFGSDSIMPDSRWLTFKDERSIDEVETKMKRISWEFILKQTNALNTMSNKQRKEFQDMIHGNDGAPELPAFTEENVVTQLHTLFENRQENALAALLELYDTIVPFKYHRNNEYKTNEVWKLGKKIIRNGVVRDCTGSPYPLKGFTNKGQDFVNDLEKVFCLMDGTPVPKEYKDTLGSKLYHVVNASFSGSTESEYFKMKWYKKGSMHIEFKRLDLVDKFNRIANSGKWELGE